MKRARGACIAAQSHTHTHTHTTVHNTD